MWRSFGIISALHMLSYALPLLIVPHLVMAVGLKWFGEIAWAQVLVGFFVNFIDYGLNYFATAEVAVNKHDKIKINSIVSEVISTKLLLWLLGSVVFLAIVFFIPGFRSIWPVYVLAYGVTLGTVFTPVFLFQGMGAFVRMQGYTLLSRLMYFVGVWWLVSENQHYLRILWLNLISVCVLVVLSVVWMNRQGFGFRFTTYASLRQRIIGGFGVFISSLGATLALSAPMLVVKMLFNELVLGVYAVVDKLIFAVRTTVQMLGVSLVDKTSLALAEKNKEGLKGLRFLMWGLAAFWLLAYGLAILFADFISKVLLGEVSELFVKSLWVLGSLPLFMVLKQYKELLLVSGGNRTLFTKATVFSALSQLILGFATAYFFGFEGFLISLFLTELIFVGVVWLEQKRRPFESNG